MFSFFQRVYVTTARQIKRIDSVKRSPIYNNFNETLNGLSSIRAYNQADRFIDKADKLLDANQKVWFMVFSSNRLYSHPPHFHWKIPIPQNAWKTWGCSHETKANVEMLVQGIAFKAMPMEHPNVKVKNRLNIRFRWAAIESLNPSFHKETRKPK